LQAFEIDEVEADTSPGGIEWMATPKDWWESVVDDEDDVARNSGSTPYASVKTPVTPVYTNLPKQYLLKDQYSDPVKPLCLRVEKRFDGGWKIYVRLYDTLSGTNERLVIDVRPNGVVEGMTIDSLDMPTGNNSNVLYDSDLGVFTIETAELDSGGLASALYDPSTPTMLSSFLTNKLDEVNPDWESLENFGINGICRLLSR
jgi:hypothetical protein